MSELSLELDLLLLKDPRKSQVKEDEGGKSFDPNPYSNTIVPSNYFLSESGRFLIFERKGIKTDLFAIEKYVDEVLEELLGKLQYQFLTIYR
jgi:hypothetical protein